MNLRGISALEWAGAIASSINLNWPEWDICVEYEESIGLSHPDGRCIKIELGTYFSMVLSMEVTSWMPPRKGLSGEGEFIGMEDFSMDIKSVHRKDPAIVLAMIGCVLSEFKTEEVQEDIGSEKS